jgi:hypothetical protein
LKKNLQGRKFICGQGQVNPNYRARIENLRAAYERGDAVAPNAILSDDDRAVRPDGILHPCKPTTREIAAALIDQYSLTQLQAVPIGHDGALATCITELVVSSGGWPVTIKFDAGEVWAKQAGAWKCRYYQATIEVVRDLPAGWRLAHPCAKRATRLYIPLT